MATLQQSASGKKRRRYQISYAFEHREKQTEILSFQNQGQIYYKRC
jgi:hypothetical protein